MRILLTGLVSVHWGRVEYGNIGNYYIVETTVRELHRVFPGSEIVTTFQMTKHFCSIEKVTVLPLELFYSWSENDLNIALKELGIAEVYKETGTLIETTPFISEILKCDLVCDFSGEMWGDHAEPVGENRFIVNLIKNRVAQLLEVPTVLLAGSQGPFNKTSKYKSFAKVVLENFKTVANREASSKELLAENGFNVSNVRDFTDPAFLFEPASQEEIVEIIKNENIISSEKKTIGFVLCGFNMLDGPYDKEPREDSEFIQFVELIEFIINELKARVFLMSHQNGFEKEPQFRFINGRDYPFAQRLFELVKRRGKVDVSNVICPKGPFSPKETKAIIKNFDMFISGRIHAFVAAVSQCVPTVIINRGHGGRSHRNIGFAKSVGLEDYISDPASLEDMKQKVNMCWSNREHLIQVLEERIPKVKDKAHQLFDSLKEVL
jgi:colanic acid/amylovoran biosynthesis protein